MAQQIKKKFIGSDQIDGSKIKLLEGQSIRGTNSLGQEVDLVKISSQDKVEVLGQEVALKSELTQESQDRQAGDAATLASAQSYADQKVADLVNSAPEVLDTLKELSDALGGDANFAATVAGQIGAVDDRVDQEISDRQASDQALSTRLAVLEADPVTKAYVDEADMMLESQLEQSIESALNQALLISGVRGMEGNLIMGDETGVMHKIVALGDGVSAHDAVNKGQLDSVEDSLESQIETAEQMLQQAIQAEQSRASQAEQDLDSRLDIVEPKVSTLESEMDMVEMAIQAEQTRASMAEQDLDGRLDILEPKVSTLESEMDMVEMAIQAEQSRASQAEQDLDARLDILEPKVSTLESEMDMVEQSVQAEQAARIAADAALQAQIDALDTGFVTEAELASAVASLESQIDDVDGYAQEIRSDLDNLDGYAQEIRSDLDQEIIDRQEGDSQTLSSANDYTDTEISGLESSLQSEIGDLQSQINTEKARIDILEAKGYSKSSVTVGAELSFIDLDREYGILLSVSVGRLMVHEGEDFTVSVVGGKTRLTWIGSLVNPSGEEAIETGDKVFFSGAF
jgi:chaperonin cofactor prefoldin